MRPTVFNSIKWTTCSTFANLLAKLGQVAILTRYLAKEDFGVVSIALLFISFTEVFVDMGFSAAVLHKQNITKEEYSSLYWFNIITGIILYFVLVLATPIIVGYYKQDVLKDVIPILSLNVIFSSFSRLQRTIQQKNLKFNIIAYIDISASVVMIVSSIVFTVMQKGVFALVYSTVLYQFVIAVVYLIYAIFVEKNIYFHLRFSEIRDYFRIGIYQVGSSLLNFLSAEMDILIIGSVYSMEILGAYTICKQLASKVYGVINPIITKVLTPTLALAQENIVDLRSKFMRSIRMISFINSPIYFTLILVAPLVLLIVYGESYVSYDMLFSVFCLNYIITAIGNPQGSLLVAVGRTDKAFYWTIFRIVVTAVSLYLGSRFSILVLAVVLLLVNVISIIPEVWYIYKPILKVSVSEYFSNFIKPILVCIVLLPIGLSRLLPLNQYVLCAIIGVLFFIGYVLLSRIINKSEYKELANFLPEKVSRYMI